MYILYEIEYMSYEGNLRTSSYILKTENEISEQYAMTVYKMNSDAWGDSPCNMISASIVNVCESKEEICDYCNYNGIFAEIYTE